MLYVNQTNTHKENDMGMLGTVGDYRRNIDLLQGKAVQYTTLTAYGAPAEPEVNGTPVTVGIAWINIFAAFCPVTPYDHYIARNGGYFETTRRERQGLQK
jgi:hypothetical protein